MRKLERSNIKYPIWRKKVDGTLISKNSTPIPNWVCEMWEIDKRFIGISSKKDVKSEVTILFDKKKWDGWVTENKKSTKGRVQYRLFFKETLTERLQEVFLMSYMREIENNIRGKVRTSIENDIPFWEFLDIEFDKKKTFIFTSHYTQKPTFPNLFQSIVKSPKIKEIEHKITGKEKCKIYKQDWRPIKEYITEIGAENVIYMLINKTKKRLYIGEAKKLISRFSSGKYNQKWEYYRYDKLPDELEKHRLELERSLIKSFSTILNNKKGIPSMDVSDYTLENTKIDK